MASPPKARAAHAAAAARAQAAASARARDGAGGRATTSGTEAAREGEYAGLVTRTVAYSVDLILINVVALAVGAAVSLALSLLHVMPNGLATLVAGVLAVAYLVWVVGYFVSFWSTTGQTPGARLMRIRVIDSGAAHRLTPWRGALRFAGLVLATIPLFAGFLIMLWDERRRCLQDRLARTVVVHAPPQARIVRHPVARGPWTTP
jgi:uncharacterized RDD family membrane protein YckC